MNEWITHALKDLVSFQKGKKVDTWDDPGEDRDFYLGAGALSGRSDGYANNYGGVSAKPNDILMLWDGERSGLAATGLSGVVASTVTRLTPTSLIDNCLLTYIFNMNFEWIQNRRTGTGVPHVPKDLGKILQVKFPAAIQEQQKIVHILQTIDQAIEKTEQLIEKYQQIKAGLMHDLFTRGIGADGKLRPPREQAPELYQETPIGWIPKDWALRTCEDVCERIIDCKNRTPPITPDGFPVIRTPNVRNGEFVDAELVYTDLSSYEIWTARGKPKPGDIVITREAPVGEVCKIPERHFQACLGQRMMLYRTNPENIEADFFLYALQSVPIQNRLDLISGGSTVGHVRVGDIRSLWMFVPDSRVEQNLIANMLNSVVRKLECQRESLYKLQKQKSGLMHDLLTGKVPVSVDTVKAPLSPEQGAT